MSETKVKKGVGVWGDAITPADTQWLWWPRIPAEAITIVGAKGGTGKGFFCSDLAAIVTLGALWPLEDKKEGEEAPHARVMWCEAEDPIDSVVIPRLIAAEADLSRVNFVTKQQFASLDLRAYIEKHNIRLIILSPLVTYLKGLEDYNAGLSVRKALEKLQDGVTGTDCAIIGIGHTNKKADLTAVERLLGSVEFANFVRSVLLLRKEPEEEGVVRVMHGKSNLGPTGDDMLFTIYNTKPSKPRSQYVAIEWSKPEENVEVDSAFDRQKDTQEDSKGAGEWLLEYLEDGLQKDTEAIFKAGEKQGHTRGAIKTAKKRMAGKIAFRRKREDGKLIVYWWLRKR
jgi:hypothetical protein